MIQQLVLAGVVILATVILHATGLGLLIAVFPRLGPALARWFKTQWHMVLVVVAVSVVFSLHGAQIWLWAAVYHWLGVFGDLETALYFSMVTFTTLGFGDIILTPDWRLLGAAQGAGGFVLFGWSTAFIFEVMARSWQRRIEQRDGDGPRWRPG